ncbi:MAG: hypothetical protein K6C34_02410 [Alphaproteobacteria bacterium]|nr:hypothetical protein [Alphaproteobacteria bacterium]
MSYASNHEGKCAFVQFLLKPLLLNMDCGIKEVRYLDEKSSLTRLYPETVEIVNANPEKSMSVNVTGDSNYALVCDVMKKMFGLDYCVFTD